MSTPDPERAIERNADDLEERIGKLDDSIGEAKKKQTERQAKDEGPLDGDDDPTTAPAKGGPLGDDASGFDDPEAEEEEEE